MSDVHFHWTTAWPHALPDVTAKVPTTTERADVTCRACLHALGSQKQDPPVEFTVRENLASAWTSYAMSTIRSGPPIGSPAYGNGLLDVLEREVERMLAQAKRDALVPLYVLAQRWQADPERPTRKAVGGCRFGDELEMVLDELKGDGS